MRTSQLGSVSRSVSGPGTGGIHSGPRVLALIPPTLSQTPGSVLPDRRLRRVFVSLSPYLAPGPFTCTAVQVGGGGGCVCVCVFFVVFLPRAGETSVHCHKQPSHVE